MHKEEHLNRRVRSFTKKHRTIPLEEYVVLLKESGYSLEGACEHIERAATLAGIKNINAQIRLTRRTYTQAWIKGYRSLAYLGTSHTKTEWELRKQQYNNQCVYCGNKVNHLTKDHIIPITRGGNDSIENIVPACIDCNRRKNARPVEYFKEGLMLKLL